MTKLIHNRILAAVSAILLATLACGGPAAPGGGDGQVAVESSSSDSLGRASFHDAHINRQLAVEFSDPSTGQPLEGISVAFISNGARLLILTSDPAKRYYPSAQEIDYSEIGLLARPHTSASLSMQSELVIAIFLMKALDVFQTGEEWGRALAENPPDLERWGFFSQDYCVNGDQMAVGMSRALGTVLSVLPGPSDLMAGIPSLGDFQDWAWLAAVADMSGNLAGAAWQADLYDRLASGGSIIRWRVFSIDGVPFGVPAVPVGWCLEPLDRNSTESVAGWLQYGFRQSDLYTFEQLIPQGQIQAGIPSTEAGGAISGAQVLENLRQSLPNGVTCNFISIDSSYSSVAVATSNWSPPFVVPTIINLFTGEVSATNVESEYALLNVSGGYLNSVGIGTYPEGTDPLEVFQINVGANQPCQ